MKINKVWIIIAVAAMLFIGCSGTRPSGLGVEGNQLSPCPGSPNCVSSQSDEPKSFVEPFSYTGEKAKAMEILKQVISGIERTKIVEQTNSYIYAECTSKLFGFVDDVEFFFSDNASVIHVRSASRIGYSDLGVNKKRVEAIRSAFAKASNR